MRSYDQYCPVAVALDTVGDRWTLLILRELLIGARRFTDVRAALPGLAPNLLTDRLRDLEREGLVERRELPPPAARTVYALTTEGRSTAPLLEALARFGAARMAPPGGRPVRPAMTVFGLMAPFHRPDGERLHARLVIDEEAFDLVSDGERLSTRAQADDVPDLLLTATAQDLVAARQGEHLLDPSAVRGSSRQRARFAQMFDLGMTGRGAARP